MNDDTITVKELLDAENRFFDLGVPSKTYPSEDIISSHCCDKYYNMFISRIDVLKCRYLYIQFTQEHRVSGKEEIRYKFLGTLRRSDSDDVYVIPIIEGIEICSVLTSRIFGVSLSIFMSALTDYAPPKQEIREIYEKTVQKLSKTLHILEDTLTRCNTCVYLTEKLYDSANEEEKKEARQLRKDHFAIINRQRTITSTLCKMSREQNYDLIVLGLDAMSNNVSKLPAMLSRPKSIGDGDRMPVTVTTIRLLYQSVGHTHSTVDAHFGNVSSAMKTEMIMDPNELATIIERLPSVISVDTKPTIYDFSGLFNFIHKPTYLLSNNQLLLSKDYAGKVHWSAAPTMNSAELFEYECEEDTFKLFTEDFNLAKFNPTIRAPTREGVEDKLENLFKSAGPFLTENNRNNYRELLSVYGKEAFRSSIKMLNDKAAYVDQQDDLDYDEKHETILNYLKKNKVNVGRQAKHPIVTSGMRKMS
ncbi:hypothetical protein CRE_24264 [Caenorhabditis remanei]|uniref:DUF7869 domain-containing protein n=1 Tax=Caenorhabditis remanei TaxID=31234 RepID=E3NHP6_CAERE|nr:hypothetical protein CRE_24264 [Caenorhabditis remanei]